MGKLETSGYFDCPGKIYLQSWNREFIW